MKDILGFEGKYAITKDARIWKHSRDKKKRIEGFFLEGNINHGYHVVGIEGKTYYVHRLFAQAFIPNPSNLPEVNHKNGIRNDNRIKNLEWVTHHENMIHAWKTGLMLAPPRKRGEQNGKAKLTAEQVIELRRLRIEEKWFIPRLAKKFGINNASVYNIIIGKHWKHLLP